MNATSSKASQKNAGHPFGFISGEGYTMRRLTILTILLALLSAGSAHAQSVGTVMPTPFQTVLDSNGNPCAGCLIYTYVAGTTTPLATYTDSTLATPNANPVVADAAGRVTIFLGPYTYKFVYQTAAGSTFKTVDVVQAIGVSAAAAATNGIVEGRLTLTSNTPVTTADVSGGAALYFTPYKGNRISLYNGSSWEVRNFSQITVVTFAATVTLGKMYDVFIYLDGSTPTASISAWTNDTTRANALTTLDGVLVLAGNTTRRYVGSFRVNTLAQTVDDTYAKRNVWNYYNRVARPMRAVEATASWTYTTATWRQANAAAANQVEFVVGWAEVPVTVDVFGAASNSNGTSVSVAVCIGEDSTSTCHAGTTSKYGGTIASSGANITLRASLRTYPTVGRHFYAWLEFSTATGTTTWYGAATDTLQSGIIAVIDG